MLVCFFVRMAAYGWHAVCRQCSRVDFSTWGRYCGLRGTGDGRAGYRIVHVSFVL